MALAGDEEDPLLQPQETKLTKLEETKHVDLSSYYVLLVVLWVAAGVAAACYFEGWTILTGLYVITQVVTTTGYGDVTVTRPAAKLVVGFYVVGTVLLIGSFVISYADRVVADHASLLREQIRKLQAPGGLGVADPPSGPSPMVARTGIAQNVKHDLAAAFALFLCFVIAGTAFFALYESCSCSYGVTAVRGCVEERCTETGGYEKTWSDSLYMSLITLTSVGFGDHTPRSRLGRAFAIVWMLFGICATANFAGSFGQVMLFRQREARRLASVSADLFRTIDVDGSGELDRHEFLRYALLKFGIASKDDLDEINHLFAIIDKDTSGTLSYAEVKAHCDQ